MSENKPENRPDPIQQTTVRIAGADNIALEHRLKLDMYNAVCKVKPEVGEGVSIEDDVYSGQFFETLKPALQGIAVSKLENSIFFYDKIGWDESFLTRDLQSALSDFHITKINEKAAPQSLHDLAYISYKHIEKMMGKTEAASYWENLKQAVARRH